MSKKNIVSRKHEQRPPASAASPAPEGNGRISPPGAGREQVAALAYELWESRGRPEGTDLEDWFRAERRLPVPHVTPLDSIGAAQRLGTEPDDRQPADDVVEGQRGGQTNDGTVSPVER